MKKRISSALLILSLLCALCACQSAPSSNSVQLVPSSETAFSFSDVPEYSGSAFVQLNGNQPYFSEENLTTDSYELYGELDGLGRCTTCIACVGEDLMPTQPRGNISEVKPTGWQSVQYDFVDGGSLYNRCHLIGFQLTAEDANENNLITGTRYMNLNMESYESLIAEYVRDYHAHVLYRVTPVFAGENLLAEGVLLEGMSVEDKGASVCFCAFLYNVQPGVVIDYRTGDSCLESPSEEVLTIPEDCDYVLNKSSKKFHLPTCESVWEMKAKNREFYSGSKEALYDMGYAPCQSCKP